MDICLLRAGPQDVPAAPVILTLAVGAYLFLGLAVGLSAHPPPQALILTVADIALLSALLYLLLRWRGLLARFAQSLTALAGTGALLSLASWPILLWLQALHAAGEAIGGPSLLLLALVIWSVVVAGHILRHALNVPLVMGLLWSLLYLLISWNLSALLIGAPS